MPHQEIDTDMKYPCHRKLTALAIVPVVILSGCEKTVRTTAPATSGQQSCNAGSTTGTLHNGIFINNAFIRAGAAGHAASAYLTLCSVHADDTLIRAEFPGAAATELHRSSTSKSGIATMEKIPSVPLPAGKSVALAPGGIHIMIINPGARLSGPVKPSLTLEFAGAGPVTVPFAVHDISGRVHRHHIHENG